MQALQCFYESLFPSRELLKNRSEGAVNINPSLRSKTPVLLPAIHELLKIINIAETMLVIGAGSFKLTLLVFGRISPADNGTLFIIIASSALLKPGAVRLELEIPFPIVFNEDFNVAMQQIPADVVILLFGRRLVYFKRDMSAADCAAFFAGGDGIFFCFFHRLK
jgi:hypothetical protein